MVLQLDYCIYSREEDSAILNPDGTTFQAEESDVEKKETIEPPAEEKTVGALRAKVSK
jgi:hypothetical protein